MRVHQKFYNPRPGTAYKIRDNWYLGIHSPYNGEVDPEFKGKVIGELSYDDAEACIINDRDFVPAVIVAEKDGKLGFFITYNYYGMQGGSFKCYDIDPFVYDEVRVVSDCKNWADYGFVLCRKETKWIIGKVIQSSTELGYERVGEGFESIEQALKQVGVYSTSDFEMCRRYCWGKNFPQFIPF